LLAPLRRTAAGKSSVGYRTVAQTATRDCPIVLHQRRPDEYLLTSCGQVLMGTEETRSERTLGHVVARLLHGVVQPRVLVGGLGMGFTLRALLDGLPWDARVVVAELLPSVVRWNRERFGPVSGHPLDDDRVRLYIGDVADLLRRRAAWDAVLLDIDNGPEWMVQKGNQALYERGGIARLRSSLRSGGVLAVWSAVRNRRFERRLASMALRVRRVRPVARGGNEDALVYVVTSARRPALSF
jgi:spermidine synthase